MVLVRIKDTVITVSFVIYVVFNLASNEAVLEVLVQNSVTNRSFLAVCTHVHAIVSNHGFYGYRLFYRSYFYRAVGVSDSSDRMADDGMAVV